MANVSRPLIALLVGTVAFFALWLVALKPHSPTSGSSSSGVGQFQGPINAAKGVQKTVDTSAAKDGGTSGRTVSPASATPAKASTTTATPAATTTPTATTPAATTPAATTPAATTPAATTISSSTPPAAKVRLTTVQQALKSHKVIALLFYNPAAPDDRSVKQELRSIPTHRGAVVKLTVPLSELSRYTAITDQVQVQYSPTLVLIDREANASTIVGFADTFEIAQRLEDALARH
jgi:hypothetical protein